MPKAGDCGILATALARANAGRGHDRVAPLGSGARGVENAAILWAPPILPELWYMKTPTRPASRSASGEAGAPSPARAAAPSESGPRRIQPYRLARLALLLASALVSAAVLILLFRLLWPG